MRNERVIVMWGKCHLIAGHKISNVAYTHDSLQVLSSFNCKNSRFLEVEIKRNRLNFTCSSYVYILERMAHCSVNAAQAGRDCRLSQQDFAQKGNRKYDGETSEDVSRSSAYSSLAVRSHCHLAVKIIAPQVLDS